MPFLRFPISLLVIRPKYPRMYISKLLNPIGSNISLMIEMLVRRTLQSILSIFCQTHSSKAPILLLSSSFNILVSTPYRKIEKTSDCKSLFLVYLKILLLHVTLRSLVSDLLRAIWCRISVN